MAGRTKQNLRAALERWMRDRSDFRLQGDDKRWDHFPYRRPAPCDQRY